MDEPLSVRDRVAVSLLVFFLLVAVVVERYWLSHTKELTELARSQFIAHLFEIYSDGDSAYYDAVSPLALALEGINVYFTQVLNVVLIYAIFRRRPYRHALQLGVGAYLSYSVVLYFLEAHLGGYPHMRHRNEHAFFLFYVVNFPWLLGHVWLVYDSAREITRQFRLRS